MEPSDQSRDNQAEHRPEPLAESEAWYRTLFESIDIGFCITELLYDEDGAAVDYRFAEVNNVFEKQTGFVNAKGRRATELAPNVSQDWINMVDSVVKTGNPVRIEAFFDDPARWYAISMSKFGDTTLPLVASVFDDITQRKEYEQRQAYLLKVSDSLRSIADPVAIEETVTRLALAHFGADRCYYCRIEHGEAIITRDAVRGELPSVAGTYPLSSFALLKAVVDAGQPFAVNNAATSAILDEEIRGICLQMQVISFLDVPVVKQGNPVGVLCIVQAVPREWTQPEIHLAIETAERTWAAVERARAEDALKDADRRKDEFLAMLAHELRNPMSTIRSGLQLLELVNKDDMSSNTIAMMNRQTVNLVRLVDDLLDVSRISQGKVELKKQQIDFVELIRQSTDSVASAYRDQGKELLVELPKNPLYLNGDVTRLTQVVTNLLTNGARYTDSNGKVWVRLTHEPFREAETHAVLEVRDNGIGLEKNQLSIIFELFVQVDNSLARSKGGLGLGLTLVKKLVEMHGGNVMAESQGLGKGSTFKVYLPALENANSSKLPVDVRSGDVGSLRVLIIDDNEDAGHLMSTLLSLKGFQVHTRNSGQDGIEAVKMLSPAVILLDIGMPGMDGYETCRMIRQLPSGQTAKIIALTGYGQASDLLHSKQAGFDAHLVKPVDIDEIIMLLHNPTKKSGF